MKKFRGPCDWWDLVVLFLTLITYVPWSIILGLAIADCINRMLA